LKQENLKGRKTLRELGVDEELHNFYPSTHIFRSSLSRMMRSEMYVAQFGTIRNAYKTSAIGRKHSGGLGVEGRVLLKCIIGKNNVSVWAGFVFLRVGSTGGLL
jgi:hypothetical protein